MSLVVVYQCECDVGSVEIVVMLLNTIVLFQCDLGCAELGGEGFGVMIGTFGDTGIHCEVAVGDCSAEFVFVNGLYPRHDVIWVVQKDRSVLEYSTQFVHSV